MKAVLRALPLTSCLVAVAAGLVLVTRDQFRQGCELVGAALLLAAVLRLALSDHAVGPLRVRARWIDVAVTAVLGLALVAVAVVVPAGP